VKSSLGNFFKNLVWVGVLLLGGASSFRWDKTWLPQARASRAEYASPFQRGKVQLSTLTKSVSGAMTKVQRAEILPRGSRLALLVDTACAGSAYYQNSRGDALLPVEARPFVLNEDRALDELSEEWNSNPCVLGVGDDGEVKAFDADLGEDPRRREQSALDYLQWASSQNFFRHPAFKSNESVVVALIDTGVDYTHPELSAHMWKGPGGEKGVNLVQGNMDPKDDNGHGTHCAGLIAASTGNGMGISGMVLNPIQVMPVKVLDSQGNGGFTALATGVRYAADNGAEVINLSLGSPVSSAILEDALQYAVSKGAVVVIAAGNDYDEISKDNFYSPIGYAPSIKGVIGVGSVDALNGRKSAFSNYSSEYVEIAAPGSAGAGQILSTWLSGGYKAEQGTSMASPMVAGAAALVIGFLKAQRLGHDPSLVEQILLDSARSRDALKPYFVKGRELNLLYLKRYLESSYVFQGRGGFEDL
jgi:hypothetical protein